MTLVRELTASVLLEEAKRAHARPSDPVGEWWFVPTVTKQQLAAVQHDLEVLVGKRLLPPKEDANV